MYDLTLSKACYEMKIEVDELRIDEMKRHEQLALYLLGIISQSKLQSLFGLTKNEFEQFNEDLYQLLVDCLMKRKSI